MRAELPWNVAGIPPEAREAARAAARREGLSVGEWLTRRILRSFSGLEEDTGSLSYEARTPSSPPLDSWGLPASSRRDSEEMLARVGRSETESNEAWRRIEEQLRGLGRRLDSNERSHSENNRALSRTAQEMNISAREQAQAFEQLGHNVMGLHERLERLERSAAHDGIKDAVKALHQGLSRLADQITTTANNSASQLVQVTANLEKLAGRVGQVWEDSDNADQALEQRIDAVGRTLDQRIESKGQELNLRLESSEKAMDTRLSAIEKTTQFNTNALDHALEKIETGTAQRSADLAETQHRAALQEAGLHRLEDTVTRLEARLPDPQQQSRLEETVTRLESQLADRQQQDQLENRLDGIEHTISGLAGTLKQPDLTEKFEASVRALSERLETLEKGHAELSADLQTKVLQPAAPPSPQPEPETLSAPSSGDFQAPPFVEPPSAYEPPAYEPAPAAFSNPTAETDAFAPHGFAFDHPQESADESFTPDFEDVFEKPQAEPENFLAQARRSARAASEKAESERRGGLNTFRWGQNATDQGEEKAKPRYLIPLLVALLVVLVAAAALVLGQRAQVPEPAPIPRPAKPVVHVPAVSVPTPPSSETQSGIAPGSAPALGDPEDFSSQRSEPAAAEPLPPSVLPGNVRSTAKPAADSGARPAASPASVQQSAQGGAPQSNLPKAGAPQTNTSNAGPSLDRILQMAKAGNPTALTILGLRALDGTGAQVNLPEAVKSLTQAAEKGQAVAQYRLGTLYERGQGVPVDAVKATHWYGLAANQGNRKAMHNLAVAHASGAAGKKNMAEAARWFAKAAALGLSDSQFNLAVLYERGDGVPQSLVDAYKWYSIAASTGDSESKARIGVLQTQLGDADRAAAGKSAAAFHAAPLNRAANVPPEPADLGN